MDVDEESFYCFFLLKHSDVVFILLINVKIVGISTFMSRINFVLRWVEHEHSFDNPRGLASLIRQQGSYTYGSSRAKTCLRGFRKGKLKTSLLSYKDWLEIWNFARSEPRYNSFQYANNKGADQTARMRRLVCAFVVRKHTTTGFLATRPNHVMSTKI